MFNTLYKKLSIFHWNVGFTTLNNGEIPSMGDITWMKHDYRDRFFADPFILDSDDNLIKVLVEEYPYDTFKGVISLLTVDKRDYKLINRKVILELDTHLSFPFIYREGGDVFVIPENSASGKLSLYKYNANDEGLDFISTIIEDEIVDPILFKQDNKYHIIASIQGSNENADLYLYSSENLRSKFMKDSENPIKSDISSSRCAGDFFTINNKLYRPAQICKNSYGEGMTLCLVESRLPLIEIAVKTYMAYGKYKYGLHTLNVHKNIIVVDGCSYLFKPLEKIQMYFKNR